MHLSWSPLQCKARCRGHTRGDAFGIGLVGVTIGLWTAYALTRYLSSFLYGVGRDDPFSYIVVAAAVGAVTAVARTPDHLDLFWVGPDGSVGTNWWDAHANNGAWNTPFERFGP